MRIILFLLVLLAFNFFASAQLADFSYVTTNGQTCSPVTVNFKSTVIGTPLGYIWNFGNGVQSNEINPSYTYTEAGTYEITLTVVFVQQVAKVIKQVIVNPAFSFAIVADKNTICKPGTINFTALDNSNVSSYNWNFGDGSTNVLTNSNSLPHNFSGFGNYAVTLVATQNTGCVASSVINVSVSPPLIAANISQTGGCVPVNVGFSTIVTVPNNGNVTNFRWDFGDGSPIMNTTVNTNGHIYAVPHVAYAPTVTITTNDGCTNTASFGNVAFGTPATVTAFPKVDTICHADTMFVTAKSTSTNLFNWAWGDGINTIAASPSFHQYSSLGAKTVMVSGYDNGCTGNTFSIPIFIKGLIASYHYSNTCANESLFQFTNTTQGKPTSILWDFGDGTTNNSSDSLNHQFINGAYTVTMMVADNISGCKEAYAKTIYIASPILVANKTIICRGDTVMFNVKSDYPNPLATYTWNIDGGIYGPTNLPSISIAVDSVGIFSNSVVVYNGLGYCINNLTEANLLIVRGPIPLFAIPSSICQSSPLKAINLTQPIINGDTVKTWRWNFGANINTDAGYQPLPYKYANAGNYNVTLKATDQYNCTYAVVKPIQIAPLPFVLSLPKSDTICFGQKAMLMAYHFDPLGWSPTANISCTNCDSITVMPTSDTKYIATVSNAFGCVATDTSFIKVYAPFAVTSAFWDTAICLKDTLQLNLSPKDQNITWSPSNGLSRNDIFNPLAFPSETTTYTAIVYDERGCFRDTANLRIIVDPLPTVYAGVDAQYPYHASSSFQPTYSTNVVSYLWSPVAQLSCVTCAIPQGIADVSTTYTVTVTSDSGCVAKDSVTIFVECMGANLLMPTAFTPTHANLNKLYYPFARGMKTITKFVIYNRLGQLVYQRTNFPPNDASYGWDGKSNFKDQSTGTYVYMVEAICDLGQPVIEKGTFTLIR